MIITNDLLKHLNPHNDAYHLVVFTKSGRRYAGATVTSPLDNTIAMLCCARHEDDKDDHLRPVIIEMGAIEAFYLDFTSSERGVKHGR